MNELEDIAALKKEVKALKTEVAGLKEFIRAMYSMISDEDDYEEDDMFAGPGIGRYNT